RHTRSDRDWSSDVCSSDLTVVERTPSRDHTERLLRSLGLRLTRAGMEIRVWPAERIPPFSLDIPGDFSSAAPFIVAATLLSGSRSEERRVGKECMWPGCGG